MLSVTNLNFSYEQEPVLKNISFHLGKGDFCAVIGPNGSGKSTLLKAVSNLLDSPFTGSVVIDGKPLATFSARTLALQLGFVAQRTDVVFDFSVFDTVMMGRHPHQSRWQVSTPLDVAVVTEMLHKNGLWPLKDRQLTQLSGGEVQRVMVARAMAQQTPLLLLDEPLANLDVAYKFEVMKSLRELNREQKVTVVVVLHDFSFAKQFADKTLLLKQGELLAFGSTEDVLTEPNVRNAFDLPPCYRMDERGNVYCE